MHISHTKSFNIPVSIALATLTHMINEICLKTTNYPIFNMQDLRYYLWTSILDCFGQLVPPPCKGGEEYFSKHSIFQARRSDMGWPDKSGLKKIAV